MPTQIKDGPRNADAREDRAPRPVHTTAASTAEQVPGDAVTATEQVRDSMVALVRQGQDTSLKSVQVWADLARQLNPAVPGVPGGVTMVSQAYDVFEMLLAAQRQFVDDLIATQRRLAQRFFDTGEGGRDGDPASR